ncbi:MAG: dephospho-CoA kinase [Spirochaetaceae bacterium]|nr:dephospho-CoA kinase [Spirochaetaceae bacterium]
MVVGVAGKLGSGKSSVAGFLADAGWRVIDVDLLGHRALATERDRIVDAFGRGVLDSEGRIDRRRLGPLVFANADARRRLDVIVHPVMVRSVKTLVAADPGPIAIDAALLNPMGLDALCDLVLWVHAPLLLRLYRALVVDRKPRATVLGAMWAQRGRRLKRPVAGVDTGSVSRRTIYNGATRGMLRRQIEFIL